MSDRMNATAKDHLFGNLRTLQELIKKMPENNLKQEVSRRLEAAISWEPLINNKEKTHV